MKKTSTSNGAEADGPSLRDMLHELEAMIRGFDRLADEVVRLVNERADAGIENEQLRRERDEAIQERNEGLVKIAQLRGLLNERNDAELSNTAPREAVRTPVAAYGFRGEDSTIVVCDDGTVWERGSATDWQWRSAATAVPGTRAALAGEMES